jgi:hypothetical protein
MVVVVLVIGIWHRVIKGVEDGRKLSALKLLSGVARPQGIERTGRIRPSDALGSSLPPLAIRPWSWWW